MAKETERYKQKAIALYSEGATYRAIAQILAREYGRAIAHHSTIFHWVKAEKVSRGALRRSDEEAA